MSDTTTALVDDLREEYAQARADRDEHPTEAGFVAWLAGQVRELRAGRDAIPARPHTAALLDELAPLDTAADVNGATLARWLTVHAVDEVARHVVLTRHMNTCGSRTTDAANTLLDAWAANLKTSMLRWALAYVLREIPAQDADRLACEIWAAWEDGEDAHQLPQEWMAEYGLDPEVVLAQHLDPAGVRGMPAREDDSGQWVTANGTPTPGGYVVAPGGPVRPPYGTPARAAYDHAHPTTTGQCPAALPADATPCVGPADAVLVEDQDGASRVGCVAHAGVLLAVLGELGAARPGHGGGEAAVAAAVDRARLLVDGGGPR